MKDIIIDIMRIPSKAVVNKKVPKTMFYKQAELNKDETKIFVNEIQSVQLMAMLNSDSIRVSPFINEEFDYSDIAVLLVELKTSEKEEIVAEIIHKAIPNPLFIILHHKNKMRFSTAMKRLNKNNASSVVIERINYSPWIDPKYPLPVQKNFLDNLALDTLPFDNLLRLYLALDSRLYLTGVIDLINIYPAKDINFSEIKKLVDKIQSLDSRIKKMQTAIKRETSFGLRMEQYVKMQTLQKQMNDLLTRLREVC